MIYIKENQLPSSNVVPQIDKYIGVENNNQVDTRTFILPMLFKGLDLTDNNFIYILKIQPANQTENPYLQLLDKETFEDEIYLKWEITRVNTKENGKLTVTILIQNDSEDIVYQSYPMEFTVIRGINVNDIVEEIPPSIFEQAIAKAALYAQKSEDEANRSKEYADSINNVLIVDGDGSKYLSNDGTYKEVGVGDGSGHIIINKDNEVFPQRNKLKFNGATISDDEENNATVITVLGGEGGSGGTTDDVLLAEDFKVVGTSIGNLTDGNVVNAGESLTTLFRAMRQKIIPPNYINPTLSISGSAPLSVEIGSNISPVISATFNKNNGGNITNYTLLKNGATVLNVSNVQTFTDASFQITGNTIFAANASYGAGEILNDNMGNPHPDGRIMAGNVSSNTVSYTTYRTAFYQVFNGDTNVPITSSEIRALTGKLNNPINGSTINLTIPIGATKIVIAYPDTLRGVSQIMSSALSMNIKDAFTLSKISVEGANGYGAIPYKVYTYLPVIPYGSADNLTITI